MLLPFVFGPVTLHDAQGHPWLQLEASPLTEPSAATELVKSDENERWITLHPHGHAPGEGGGVHVKIRVQPDGSAHVISGPGELRGLRLTRLASPEELAKRRAERQVVRKERPSSSVQATAPEEGDQAQREDHTAKLRDLSEQMTELHGKLLEHAARLTGDQAYQSERAQAAFDPAAHDEYRKAIQAKAAAAVQDSEVPDDDRAAVQAAASGAGAVIASENIRRITSGLKSLRRHVIQNLVQDSELREAVLGADGELDPGDEQLSVSGSPGYQRRISAQAAAHGYTPEQARAEAESVFAERMAGLRAQGEHDKADAIEQMREKTMDRARARKYITGTDASVQEAAPVRAVDPARLQQHADDARSFLNLHTQLEDLERQYRHLLIVGRDPQTTPEERDAAEQYDQPVQGAEIDADVGRVGAELRARLEREIQDVAKVDLTRAFLDAVDQSAPHAGLASEQLRRSMTASLGSGAYGHLANAALAVVGHEGVDRQVVDALGVDAAAQLVAYALRRDAPDQLDVARAGLGQHHDEHSIQVMHQALEFARAARADAAELEVPSVSGSMEAAVARDVIRERKRAIAQAQEHLGTAMGVVEAGAALNLALRGKGRQELRVRFGAAQTEGAALQLRALGLQDGQYTLSRDPDTNELQAVIHTSGMDQLTQRLAPERQAQAQLVASIKRGDQDEEQYLPAGFLARNPADETATPGIPTSFQAPVDFSQGVEAVVSTQAARLYADGHTPRQILDHLLDTVARDVPDGQAQAFADQVTRLLPFADTEQRIAKDGTPYTAHVARDVDNDPAIQARLQQLSQTWLSEHQPGVASFHGQRLDDTPQTRDALFRAIAEEPALQAAFALPSDLGGSPEGRRRATAVKDYFLRHIVGKRLEGKTPQEFDERAEHEQRRALTALGPVPEKWAADAGSLFGGPAAGEAALTLNPLATPEQHASALAGYGLRPGEHYQLEQGRAVLTPAGRDVLKVPSTVATVDGTPEGPAIIQGGLDTLNPAWVRWQSAHQKIRRDHPTTSDLWADFKSHAGSTRRAYAAVQEQMQGDLVRRFTSHHAALTGQQLRVSKRTGQHWESRLSAGDPEKAAEIRARDRALMDELRERDSRGRYAQMEGGSLAGAVQARVEKMNRQSQLMGGLGFDLAGSRGGGEVQGTSVHDLDVGPHEVPTIGRAAEQQLAHLLATTRMGVRPTDGPVGLIKGLGWGASTVHVGKQRGVKMLLGTGRLLGFYGAGSGKTAMQIGAFTQAHAEGRARKALLVVPSIVRNQFGEEAARFTEPGRYSWHAQDASFAERKGHYTGDTHMVVTTHATFRDDMLRLMAEHRGQTVSDLTAAFNGMDRPTRTATLAAALEHHGIPLDYLAVDEAHDFLNRAGKADSGMSKVLEAALDIAKFKSLWTGSPVKNDASEIYDWISKVDPGRFQDREEFLRRYGVDTRASAEALQRLTDTYAYVDSVTPQVQRTVVWGAQGDGGHAEPIPLSPEQQSAYQAVHDAFERASVAARKGQVDIEACRTLSPRSFQGVPTADHAEVAGRLQSALGTLKHSALGRVLNEHDAATNAKVQHVLGLAAARRGRGGVIFARNRASVAMLKRELEAKGHKVGVIDGATSTDNKGRVRKAFDQGLTDIVICSDAGATGANLQARGEYLINYDLPLTQKTLEQRNARIDRLGQRRAIELHHLVTDTAYDRDNIRRLERKAQLGGILQGEFRNLEDTGLAASLQSARAEQAGDGPPSWEEPLDSRAVSAA